MCEQWGSGTGSWGTLHSLFLGHFGKCLSTVTAAGSAQPEAEQLWLPPSQAFLWLLGYHCVYCEWANICPSLVYIRDTKKFSKTIFASMRFFAKVHYWIDLGVFAHHILDPRFANCKPCQGEWKRFLNVFKEMYVLGTISVKWSFNQPLLNLIFLFFFPIAANLPYPVLHLAFERLFWN